MVSVYNLFVYNSILQVIIKLFTLFALILMTVIDITAFRLLEV